MVAKLFEFKYDKMNWGGALRITVGLLVSLIVLTALGQSKYWGSFAFGILFVGISDLYSPGDSMSVRTRRIVITTLAGALITGLGTALGVNWALATMGTFVIALLFGASEAWGKTAAFAAYLVLIWYFVSLGFHGGLSQALPEALAWLLGGALYLLLGQVKFRRKGSSSPQAEQEQAPVQESGSLLSRYFAFFSFSSPLFHFNVLKALAVALAAGIGLGFNLPYAYWIPLFTHIVMQPGRRDSLSVFVLRLLATIVGAVLASVLLGSIHSSAILEVIAVICVFIGVALHNVNLLTYLFFTTLSILLLDGLSTPGTLTDVRARVLNVLIGSLIALAFALLYQVVEKLWPYSVASA